MASTSEKMGSSGLTLEFNLLVSKVSEIDSLHVINHRKGELVCSAEKELSKIRNLYASKYRLHLV